MTTTDHTARWDAADRFSAEFPELRREQIVAILIDARHSAEMFALPRDDELLWAEKIAGEQFKQLTGRSEATGPARLDPERHPRAAKR